MVDMPLDGKTYKVSSVVADAFQKEMNNPNGCDARAAYAGTTGAQSPGTPWTSVEVGDPQHPLKTGDVVQWGNRSGLLIVDPDGTLKVMFNGAPVPLDAEVPPAGREFFHPSGSDLDGAAQQAPSAPEPATVSPPATPSAPPAVTPPITI
jgi:hypothetical protein